MPRPADCGVDAESEAHLKIVLNGETAVTVLPQAGVLTFEAEDERQQVSAFHLLGASLAVCTFSVLHSWAQHSKLDAGDLHMVVEWEFGDNPHRLSRIRSRIHWPSLPESRKGAASRAADLCAVHATLTSTVHIDTVVNP